MMRWESSRSIAAILNLDPTASHPPGPKVMVEDDAGVVRRLDTGNDRIERYIQLTGHTCYTVNLSTTGTCVQQPSPTFVPVLSLQPAWGM